MTGFERFGNEWRQRFKCPQLQMVVQGTIFQRHDRCCPIEPMVGALDLICFVLGLYREHAV